MTLEKRISLITLGVHDVMKATEFYQALGWQKSAVSQEAITFIQLNSNVLALFSRTALAEDAKVPDSAPGFSGITLAQNLGSQALVDEAYAHAIACGAKAVKPPESVFWGGYSGYFADPDGHLWELAYNPFFPMDEDGFLVLPE